MEMKKIQKETKRRMIRKREKLPISYNQNQNLLSPDGAISHLVSLYKIEGYRQRTYKDYQTHWKEFFTIIPKDNIQLITKQDFRIYIQEMLENRELSPVTVNIRLTALRAMFNRLVLEGILKESPANSIKKLRIDQQKIKVPTDEQLRILFAQIDKNLYVGYRDHCVFMTMLRCGLRISEINELKVEDVDFKEGVIFLPGTINKNRKNRIVPIPKRVENLLKQLIDESKHYFGEIKYVFVNQFGEKLSKDRIRKRLEYYSKSAGFESNITPHMFRHKFAINMLKSGLDIRTLQRIMGHAQMATTTIYLDYTSEDVKEQFKKIDNKHDTFY